MAGRTQIAALSVSRTALTALPAPSVAGDVANGNFCLNDGATTLVLLNNDGSNTHTLTVQVASGVDGLTAGPRSYTLPISTARQIVGPFPVQFYGSQLAFNVDSAQVAVQPVSTFGP